jgi:penicillin-binding protein 1B
MAVLLEMHYEKDEILETYLNEIYFGQDRDRAIHGVGLAAQYYFAKDVQYLSVAESATLVGMVRGRGTTIRTSRRRAPSSAATSCCAKRASRERSRSSSTPRRARRRSASATSRAWAPRPTPRSSSSVHKQLRRDYDEKDLRSEGLRIFTTLDPRAQGAAENALTRRLAQFDKEKRFGQPGLEGAVVMTDPQSGEVQAMVGGRDVRYAATTARSDAARPVGSLLKPRST